MEIVDIAHIFRDTDGVASYTDAWIEKLDCNSEMQNLVAASWNYTHLQA